MPNKAVVETAWPLYMWLLLQCTITGMSAKCTYQSRVAVNVDGKKYGDFIKCGSKYVYRHKIVRTVKLSSSVHVIFS